MAIYRGLNATLYLGDVDNLNISLNNLGLNINDLNRIRGLSNSITQKEFHLLSGLEDDQEKETYSAYRSSFDVYKNINTLTDIYGIYKADAIVNNQIRASAIKYNFLQYNNTATGYTVESADISTSRVSSWSNIDGTIYYGSNLEVNPNIGGSNYADNTQTVVAAEKIKFLGNITQKRFVAEVPTNTVRLNINGTDYEFFAMKNIPLSFDAFFKDLNLLHLVDGLGGAVPTVVNVDYTTDPPTEYQYELFLGGQTVLSTPRTGRKRIDFYYRPDGILWLGLPRANIALFPEAILPNLARLELTQNIFTQMPDFATYTPSLEYLDMQGNALSQQGTITAKDQILNRLPVTLEELYINGTYTETSTIDLRNLVVLRTFEFNSFWGNGNIRKSGDTNVAPIPSANLSFYTVQSQSFTSVPYEMTQPLELLSINLFNNNIRGARNSANNATVTITLDVPKLIYLDLSKNQCQPVNLANNNSVEIINHYDNYSYATDDVSTHYTGCSNLRVVNFSNSFIRGDLSVFSNDIQSLTSLNLENTRLYGTFAGLANAAENLEQLDETGNLIYDSYKLFELGFLSITKGLFSSQVDTNTNFFGNRLNPVQVSSGKQLIRAKTELYPDINNTFNTGRVVFDLNSTDPSYYNFSGSGDSSKSVTISEEDLYNNIAAMQSNEVGRIDALDVVLKGNVFEDSKNAIIVVGDSTNIYAWQSNRTNTYKGVAALFDSNKEFIRDLVPRNINYNNIYFPVDRFGEAVAINSNRVAIGFPGRKSGPYAYSGGVEIFTHSGSHYRTIAPNRIGRLGTKLVMNESYIFAFDAQSGKIYRYTQNGTSESDFVNSNKIGANRTITEFKVHEDKLYVGAIGTNDSTAGRVFVFGAQTGSLIKEFSPQNANNITIAEEGVTIEYMQNKYERYFGSQFIPVPVGNAEILIVSSTNPESLIQEDYPGEFANTEWSNAFLDNNDQIVILEPSTEFRYACNGLPGVTNEIPDGTSIDVEWLNANNEPQFLTGYYLRRDQSIINDTGSIILDLDPGAVVHGFDGNFDGTITKISFTYDKYLGWGYGSTIEAYDYETEQYTDSLPTAIVSLNANTDFITAGSTFENSIGAFKAKNFTISDYVLNANTDIGRVVYSYPGVDVPNDPRITSSLDEYVRFEITEAGEFTNGTAIPITASSNLQTLFQTWSRFEKSKNINLFNSFAIFEDKETQNTSKLFRLMPSLDTFKLGDNANIAGKLPDLSYLYAIVNIEIFKTSLSGTVDLNALNTLKTIRLNNNLFDGVFPETNLPNVQLMYLNNNRFTGLGKPIMPALEYLDASGNLMTGSVPEFTSAIKLRDINLSNNLFTDYISGSVATCLSLRKLDFSNNQLTIQDAFRLFSDLETNYNNNNRGGVNVVLLGNAGISEALINQNSVYSSKLSYLRNIAGWTILVN